MVVSYSHSRVIKPEERNHKMNKTRQKRVQKILNGEKVKVASTLTHSVCLAVAIEVLGMYCWVKNPDQYKSLCETVKNDMLIIV